MDTENNVISVLFFLFMLLCFAPIICNARCETRVESRPRVHVPSLDAGTRVEMEPYENHP